MEILTKQRLFLFVDRTSQRWVIRDSDRVYWTISATADA